MIDFQEKKLFELRSDVYACVSILIQNGGGLMKSLS